MSETTESCQWSNNKAKSLSIPFDARRNARCRLASCAIKAEASKYLSCLRTLDDNWIPLSHSDKIKCDLEAKDKTMEIPLLLNDIRKNRIERRFMRKILLLILSCRLCSRSQASIRYYPSKHKYLDNNNSRRMRTEKKEDVEKIHSSENWIRFMVSCLPPRRQARRKISEFGSIPILNFGFDIRRP